MPLLRILAGLALVCLFAPLTQCQAQSQFVVGGVLGNLSDPRVVMFGQPVLSILGMTGQNRNTLLTWADKTEDVPGPPSAHTCGTEMFVTGRYSFGCYAEGWLSATHGLAGAFEADTGSACEPDFTLPPVRGPDGAIQGCITVTFTAAATVDENHRHDSGIAYDCEPNGARFAGPCFYVNPAAIRPTTPGISSPRINTPEVLIADLTPCDPGLSGTIQAVSNAPSNMPNTPVLLTASGPYHSMLACLGHSWVVIAGAL